MKAVTEERLSEIEVENKNESACCVVMASKGYPEAYESGFEITIPDSISDRVFVAGAKEKDGKLISAGGRVLGVSAVADSLTEALSSAYCGVKEIKFENAYYRNDIGRRALMAIKEG